MDFQRREDFRDDMVQLMQVIRVIATKHELPMPELVLHPDWRSAFNHSATQMDPVYHASKQFAGVTIHFGITRQERVIL